MKCKVCGGEIQENSQFCTNCGAKVEENNVNESVENHNINVSNIENSFNFNELKENATENNININNFNNLVNNLDNVETLNNTNEVNGIQINNDELDKVTEQNNDSSDFWDDQRIDNDLNQENSIAEDNASTTNTNINEIPEQNIINDTPNMAINNNMINNNIENNNLNQPISDINNIQNINEVNNVPTQSNLNTQNIVEEKASIGLAILSFLIPLVGLIIFLIKKDKQPKTAKTSGICALIGFMFGIVFSVILMIIAPVIIAGSIIDDVKDKVEENQQILEEEIQYNTLNNVVENVVENNDIVNDDENTKNDEVKQNINVSNDWKKYEIIVNDKTLVLPMTYNDLSSATGFTFKSDAIKSYIGKNKYGIVNMYKNENLALYTEILNDTEEDKLYVDCKITKVWQTKYQVEKGADIITFPGGLKVNDQITEERIIELFGQPTKIRDNSSEGNEIKTYIFNEDTTWTTIKYYEIKTINGVINELVLDNRK